jgi:hypothetical protein
MKINLKYPQKPAASSLQSSVGPPYLVFMMKNVGVFLDQLQLVPSGGDIGPRRDQHGTNIFCNLRPGPIWHYIGQ